MREPGTCHHCVPLMAWCNACAIENVEAKKREAEDAARYRWLKANHLQTGADSWIRTGDDLEEAIDAAMASSPSAAGDADK